jgi:hypothetical protein
MTKFHHPLDGLTFRPNFPREVFGHPSDVLHNPRLGIEQKRALLASWASDANAVQHVPSLRQLPDGSIVKVDDILQALKTLDGGNEVRLGDGNPPTWHRAATIKRWFREGRSDDDDDDPPPCPAYAAPRPKAGGGEAYAPPDAVAA